MRAAPLVWITPDSTRALYLADAFVDERFVLFSVPLDGSQAPVALGTIPVSNGGAPLDSRVVRLTPDGLRAIYLGASDVNGMHELFSVPVAGGPAVRLSGTTGPDQDVYSGFVVVANGLAVLFRGDLEADARDELWIAPVDGSRPRQRSSHLGHPDGDVQGDFALSTNQHFVYYRADAEVDQQVEFYRFPIGTPPVRRR